MDAATLTRLRHYFGRRAAAAIADASPSSFPTAGVAWTATLDGDSVPIGSGASALDGDTVWNVTQDGQTEPRTRDPYSGSILQVPTDSLVLVRPVIALAAAPSEGAQVTFYAIHFSGVTEDDQSFIDPATITDQYWQIGGPSGADGLTSFQHQDCMTAFVPEGRDLHISVEVAAGGASSAQLVGLTLEGYPI